MKIIKKNVYYCDFCNKRSLRSLKQHEQNCTGNPDRTCRLCERTEGIREIGDKYKIKFEIFMDETEAQYIKWKEHFTLADLERELEEPCPNCILALIRYIGLNRYYFMGEFKYDYKAALLAWWAAENEKEYEREHYGGGWT